MKVKNLPSKYLEFIEECKLKSYEDVLTHKHHILPKFMGGIDDESNYVILSVKDHFKAHKLLAELSTNMNHIIGNKLSAGRLTSRYEDFDISREEAGRLISEGIREYYKHNEHPSKGKSGVWKHTDEAKKQITNTLLKRYETHDVWNKGTPAPQISKSLKIWHETHDNSFKNRKHTDKTRKQMSENHADVSGGKNPASRRCIDESTGIVYDTIKELAESVGVPRTTMNRWVKNKNKKQYNYK